MAGLPVTAPVPVMGLGQDTAVLPAVGAAAAAVAVEDPGTANTQRGPVFWVLLTLGVLAVGLATVLVGRAIFGSPAVERVTVPNLSGLTVPQATALLSQQGLVLGTQTPQTSPDRPKDTIIGQTPPSGEQIEKGQKVDVTVSTGKAQSTVPQLVGLTSSDAARAALVDANLTLGKVTQVKSDQPAGVVVAQSVPFQTTVDAGTPVDISVSDGKTTVPNVVGESEAQARSDLTNAGFETNVVQQQDGTVPPGQVLAQSPKAGASAVKGTLVTITVATAPPATQTPTPTPTPTPATTTPAPTAT